MDKSILRFFNAVETIAVEIKRSIVGGLYCIRIALKAKVNTQSIVWDSE